MSERTLIDATPEPRTRDSLARDLRNAGIEAGMTLLVHSSLKSLGWVSGGPIAVIQALFDVVGDDGTLVMPAHTSDNSDPVHWQNPPVPPAWQQTIRDTWPAFDPRITPTREMGAIAELFRTWPGTIRSDHPAASFSANGRNAATIVGGHELTSSLGEASPLARVYDLGGHVLLLGVGYDRNTSFHLAEYRSGIRPLAPNGAAMLRDGVRAWVAFEDVDFDSDCFPAIGAEFEQTGQVRTGAVGSATVRLFSQPAAVDFATVWMKSR
jgi:aminoglycoside 3-N-acetyltransferase